MPQGGSWPQATPYGSGGYTYAVDSPSQPSSSNSPHRFNPHLLTADFVQQGKTAIDSVLGSGLIEAGGDRDMWVADSGSTFQVTGNPFGMVECRLPPPPEKSSLVVGDMRSLKIGFFGELALAMHCAKGDVKRMLMNVACLPGVKFNLCSLHAVMQMHEITLNPEGAHLLDGEQSFSIGGAGSYIEASRIADVQLLPP